MRRHRIAVIGADGIGPEVIAAGCRIIDAAADTDGGFAMEYTEFDWGSDHYRRTGKMMPDDGVETIRDFDAIYFGAVGDREIPDAVTLWGLRLAICQGLDQYANVRPTRTPARCHRPPAAGTRRGHRLGDRPRELGRRVCRRRRPRTSRPAHRARHGRCRLHPHRRRPHRPLRLRPRHVPAPAQAHHRDEVERPAPRDGVLGRRLPRRSSRTIPASTSTGCWSTP